MMRFRFWLLCFSIALNVFFVGVYLAARLPRPTRGGPVPAQVMPYKTLGLSARQRAVFETERDRFHGQMMQTRQAIRARQEELIHLLSAEKPDRAAIGVQQQEILRLQGRLQDSVISHLLDVSDPLSQMQRERFFALLKERMISQGPMSSSVCD